VKDLDWIISNVSGNDLLGFGQSKWERTTDEAHTETSEQGRTHQ